MGLIGDIADKATSMLGGGAPPKAAAMVEAEAKFVKGDPWPLAQSEAAGHGSVAKNHGNVLEVKELVEFVHFGHVHTDALDSFPHPVMDDTSRDALKKLRTGTRGIAFRASLQREALLLDGFIGSMKAVLQECKDSEGGVDNLAGALTSLAKTDASAATDPAMLDPYQKGVTVLGAVINKDSIQYKEIHETGMKLHQVRAKYQKFIPQLAQRKSGGGGGGLLGNLPASLPIPPIPGVGDAGKLVMGLLFKMFDIYKAMYFNLREAYEPAIEKACYQRSIEAIRGRYAPIFDIWSIQPPVKEEEQGQPAKVLNVQKTGSSGVDGAVDDVNKGFNDATDAVQDVKDKWAEFWGTQPEPGPGEAQVEAIFAAVPKPAPLVFKSFSSVLEIGNLPEFIQKVLSKVIDTCSGMLKEIYKKLQDRQVVNNLTEEAFFQAGRIHITGMIRGILTDLLPALKVGPVNSGMVAGKASSLADELLGEHLGVILHLSMGAVYDKISAARDQATKCNTQTLEVYLALQPQLLALMVRNTFFPVWQILVEKVFGTAGGIASMVTSPVKDLMDKAKKKVKEGKDKAQETSDDITNEAEKKNQAAKKAEEGVQRDLAAYNMNVSSPIGQTTDALSKATGGLSDSILGGKPGAQDPNANGGPGFPGTLRVFVGSAKDIELEDVQEVDQKQRINAA